MHLKLSHKIYFQTKTFTHTVDRLSEKSLWIKNKSADNTEDIYNEWFSISDRGNVLELKELMKDSS